MASDRAEVAACGVWYIRHMERLVVGKKCCPTLYSRQGVEYGTLLMRPADPTKKVCKRAKEKDTGKKGTEEKDTEWTAALDLFPADADTQTPPVVLWRLASCDESAMAMPTDHDEAIAEAEGFLDQVYGLLDSDKKDEATDLVYDRFHELLTEGDYEQCCAIFIVAEPNRLGSSVSRSLLSLTVKRKRSIWSRAKFYRSAFAYITVIQDEARAKRLLGHLA